jgi:hypothetical protein
MQMGLRTLEDTDGTTWQVWDVVPINAHEGLEKGWLCFERNGEKRRLTPIPEDWETRSDAELLVFCRAAEAVKPRRRIMSMAEAGG